MLKPRRPTISNPTGTFSLVAHEALDHIVADGENDDRISDGHRYITYQPSRRRLKVS